MACAKSWRRALIFAGGLTLVALLGGVGSASPRRTTVRAQGQAVIAKGNAQAAEAQAAAIAYRQAVEAVAISLGGPRAGKDALIDQLLYDHAANFVTNSAIVQRRASGVLLKLELTVEVAVDAVQSVLSERLQPRRTPVRAALPSAAWVMTGPLSTAAPRVG